MRRGWQGYGVSQTGSVAGPHSTSSRLRSLLRRGRLARSSREAAALVREARETTALDRKSRGRGFTSLGASRAQLVWPLARSARRFASRAASLWYIRHCCRVAPLYEASAKFAPARRRTVYAAAGRRLALRLACLTGARRRSHSLRYGSIAAQTSSMRHRSSRV